MVAPALQAPARPRVPLTWHGVEIGSVEPTVLARPALQPWVQLAGSGLEVRGEDLTAALDALALGLRAEGLSHVWRNEQLAVADAQGRVLGTVERGVVRVLGIATTAVHLAAWSEDGAHWLQQRAFDKPTDPGLWDTLVGGMVSAADSVAAALERETWEEAGLRPEQLADLRLGGCIATRRPAAEVAHGYVVERLHWYRCVLPAGVEPANQDGEVACFRRMDEKEVAARMEAGEFTLDASLILRQAQVRSE